MALTLQDISAYTNINIVPKTTDTIFLQSPTFTRLSTRNAERFTGGLYIQRPIIVGELNGDAVGKGQGFNIDYVTTDSALVNYMKVYYVNITLYGFDSMQNDGEHALFSQIETKFQNASLKMGKLLATNMYLDNTSAGRTNHVDGFKQWYDDGNNYPTIGGITRSDVAPVGTVGGLNAYQANLSTFTLPQLNTAYGNAWFGPDRPDLLTVTQNAWNLIWGAIQPNQRYYDKDSDVGVAGFEAFRFNAGEVVVDKYLPANYIFGLNTKYIEWYFSMNKKFQFGFTGFKEASDTMDVAGQFLVGNNIIVPNPRTGFKLTSTLF